MVARPRKVPHLSSAMTRSTVLPQQSQVTNTVGGDACSPPPICTHSHTNAASCLATIGPPHMHMSLCQVGPLLLRLCQRQTLYPGSGSPLLSLCSACTLLSSLCILDTSLWGSAAEVALPGVVRVAVLIVALRAKDLQRHTQVHTKTTSALTDTPPRNGSHGNHATIDITRWR